MNFTYESLLEFTKLIMHRFEYIFVQVKTYLHDSCLIFDNTNKIKCWKLYLLEICRYFVCVENRIGNKNACICTYIINVS